MRDGAVVVAVVVEAEGAAEVEVEEEETTSSVGPPTAPRSSPPAPGISTRCRFSGSDLWPRRPRVGGGG